MVGAIFSPIRGAKSCSTRLACCLGIAAGQRQTLPQGGRFCVPPVPGADLGFDHLRAFFAKSLRFLPKTVFKIINPFASNIWGRVGPSLGKKYPSGRVPFNLYVSVHSLWISTTAHNLEVYKTCVFKLCAFHSLLVNKFSETSLCGQPKYTCLPENIRQMRLTC